MDIPGSYRGGAYPQHISRKEIEIMKKNMKKVPSIHLKQEIYHSQEEKEADHILKTLTTSPEHPTTITVSSPKSGPSSLIQRLRKSFISLFSPAHGKYTAHQR